MKVLRRTDYPDGKFTNTFIGYGLEEDSPILELTHNWEQESALDLGNAWGHICIEVPDVYATCKDFESEDVTISTTPGPIKHGTRVIAFIVDPDGYKVEQNESITKSLN